MSETETEQETPAGQKSDARGRLWDWATCLEAGKRYAERNGKPPSAMAFNPAMARSKGNGDMADHFEEMGDYPYVNTVIRVTPKLPGEKRGKWSTYIAALGFTPRARGGQPVQRRRKPPVEEPVSASDQ